MMIETLLSPLELPALARRDLCGKACVVFDILRATSTFVTALNHGAEKIFPVTEISEAVAFKRAESKKRITEAILLAGERDGVRICAAQSGGIDFDLGNSPREYTPEKVRGKIIVSTTTNGTCALQACAPANLVLAASFLNLQATADYLRTQKPAEILLVCAGTGHEVADEDVLAAGALAELLVAHRDVRPALSNTTESALKCWQAAKPDLFFDLSRAKNGQRLLALPDLRDDVAFCAQRDIFNLVAALSPDGSLRQV
jgi:2-phosphosulfolactate phosphatase